MAGEVPPRDGNDLSSLMTREQKPGNYYKSAVCSCRTQHVNVGPKKEAKKTKEIRIMHETSEFMRGGSGGRVCVCVCAHIAAL